MTELRVFSDPDGLTSQKGFVRQQASLRQAARVGVQRGVLAGVEAKAADVGARVEAGVGFVEEEARGSAESTDKGRS